MKPKRDLYIFFGPPGAGKTSQAVFLQERMHVHYISWGRISRQIVAGMEKFSHFQKKVQDIMKNDKHFPKGFIKNILIKEIQGLKDSNAVLIDGFPRRKSEAKELLDIIKRCNLNLKALVKFNINFSTLQQRIDGRKYCRTCGRFYNKLRPSLARDVCDFDGTTLEKRWDDDAERGKSRFDEYLEESLGAYHFLVPHAKSSFDANADQEENLLFSEILGKLSRGTKQIHHIMKNVASADLETKYGTFRIIGYQNQIDYTYHLALAMGDLHGERNVPTRIHSSCVTGDIFHSRKCDCGDQLATAMSVISKRRRGLIIYLFQEGRGINILNKIRAYDLQARGYDTVDANETLGFPAELREYDAIDDILADLEVRSIDLMTNNPDKFNKLHSLGIIIENRIPLKVKKYKQNARYMHTKKVRMGHMV